MSQERGIFILSAGANASGKSTVIKLKYVKNRVKHYLDPDRLLPVAENDILSIKARELYELKQPAKFAIECMKDWLASERIRSEGIATESNLLTQRHDFECFRVAKECGMRTELYFVGLPYDTAKERERRRVANGEQAPIDSEKFDRRYKNGLPNIQKHINSGNVDVIMVYDNSRGKGEEQLLLHIENGKTLYLHPEPPQWFRDAEINIPPVLAQ